MREVTEQDQEKRGCFYCMDMIRVKCKTEDGKYRKARRECPYDTCPYHELDDHGTYTGYLESVESELLEKEEHDANVESENGGDSK